MNYLVKVEYQGQASYYDVWADTEAQAFDRAKIMHAQKTGLPVDACSLGKRPASTYDPDRYDYAGNYLW